MYPASSFAHGANDVANSIAPLAAIIYIYRYGELNSEAPVNKWILAYGGCGLVLGLLCYGYKVRVYTVFFMKTIDLSANWKFLSTSRTEGNENYRVQIDSIISHQRGVRWIGKFSHCESSFTQCYVRYNNECPLTFHIALLIAP